MVVLRHVTLEARLIARHSASLLVSGRRAPCSSRVLEPLDGASPRIHRAALLPGISVAPVASAIARLLNAMS